MTATTQASGGYGSQSGYGSASYSGTKATTATTQSDYSQSGYYGSSSYGSSQAGSYGGGQPGYGSQGYYDQAPSTTSTQGYGSQSSYGGQSSAGSQAAKSGDSSYGSTGYGSTSGYGSGSGYDKDKSSSSSSGGYGGSSSGYGSGSQSGGQSGSYGFQSGSSSWGQGQGGSGGGYGSQSSSQSGSFVGSSGNWSDRGGRSDRGRGGGFSDRGRGSDGGWRGHGGFGGGDRGGFSGGRGRGGFGRGGNEDDENVDLGFDANNYRGRGGGSFGDRGRGGFGDRGRGRGFGRGGRGGMDRNMDTNEPKKSGGVDWTKEAPVRKPFPDIKEPPPPPPPSDKPWTNYSSPNDKSGDMSTLSGMKRKFEAGGRVGGNKRPEPVMLPPKPKKPKEEEVDLTPYIEAHLQAFCSEMKDEEKKRAEESLKPLMKSSFCVLCNAKITAPQQAETHYKGKNHLKKVKTFVQSGGEMVPKPKTETKQPEKDPKDMSAEELKEYEAKQVTLDQKVAEVCVLLSFSSCLPFSTSTGIEKDRFMFHKWKVKVEQYFD